MAQSKLMELTYYDPVAEVRLTAYADTLILERQAAGTMLCAVRFGGYPEVTRAMADAIYGGAVVEATIGTETIRLQAMVKRYRRQFSHDGIYAVATLLANDEESSCQGAEEAEEQTTMEPRQCYLFCPAGDRERLFEELDHKTAAPLIPAFRDYVLDTLIQRRELRPLRVLSLREKLDAWVLELQPEDRNIVTILEEGLHSGAIAIPGATSNTDDGFSQVDGVTSYLNTFGVTVADRIRNQFLPLFDPAAEPLSPEILQVNDHIQKTAGYSLYDAQLAVAEAVKRQLHKHRIALIRAECGSGKSKIGATALGALHDPGKKSFHLVLCPSHVTRKWVREIEETLPNTMAMVVRTIADVNRLYRQFQLGSQTVYAVFSKERARDGYMRYPAILWNRRRGAFLCPDCMEPLIMEISDDGTKYTVPADQFFFQSETKKNHRCPHCGSVLWAPVNSAHKIDWVKLGEYGWVHRSMAREHLTRTKNPTVLEQLEQVIRQSDSCFPVRGAQRRYPLSTYIKKKLRGRVGALLCDELHEYSNASGQGDAMAELFAVSRYFVGMTATLINGYSSGIFHLLYRIVPGLMQKDGKEYRKPGVFDAEYGVVETTYTVQDGTFNANRRTTRRKTRTRQLPGVSPLVFSRFLLEYTAFLSLSDMGKALPEYEEIPVPLHLPEEVQASYRTAEQTLQRVLRSDQKLAQKILSAYLGLLTVYPDQPYDHPAILHPLDGTPLVEPESHGDFQSVYPKEETVLEIVRQKLALGQKVLIYTSWTRTDSQDKLVHLLRAEGFATEVLTPKISPEKREAWVERQLRRGLQVLITNPRCVETGLDLNAFTTLIFYSMGYNLFTLRQASRRSWRINQTAPRVEVYLLYYADTMQAKAMKLMASKLAVAGIIEGTFSDEGLAAMSDVKDLTSQMARELSMGIRDSVEDIASAFRKMAVLNPERVRAAQAAEPVCPAEPPLPRRTCTEEEALALYEAMLQQSTTRSTRSKCETVDADQLSLFDLVA